MIQVVFREFDSFLGRFIDCAPLNFDSQNELDDYLTILRETCNEVLEIGPNHYRVSYYNSNF